MLSKLKLLLNISDTSKDTLLTLIIENATQYVKNYTHNDDLDNLQNVILKIAVIDYNRIGSEGLNSESYTGVSFGYDNTYPASIIAELQANRKARFI